MLRDYRDLRAWQDAVRLARECYLLTRRFPREELFGLTSQIRRAATSVPANIAEGNGRGYRREYARFLAIANGSLRELETHLVVARDVGLLGAEDAERCISEANRVGRRLRALASALTSDRPPRP